ncbi:hypothetical protein [Streptomyces sp. RKAG337]|uniref:hypothetical protein n=1 Tax=Streptomyces sp. RKAG337 TaxID=2893404 RepID=UPI0020334D16|nr:hypothetical protein [Streptomyces sp. RKAG337]MCM2431093.1 hypothetical protein [Streptomyces sp. RKAG337]
MTLGITPGDRTAEKSVDSHGVAQLNGVRLRIETPTPVVLGSVLGMLVPACSVAPPDAVTQWTLKVEERSPEVEDRGGLFDGRLVLELPYGGRRLAVVGVDDEVLRVAACYRPGATPVVMEVDSRQQVTRLVVAPGDVVGLRWADYLGRVFFASRLLASGWRMLHASAVAVDDVALVFLAGRHGGKSTLAHRAVRELGARFLADDLVLIGPDRTVVGWPTRVAVPAELVGDIDGERRERTVVAGVRRDRFLFTPAQHRAALGIAYSPPVPLGAVVIVDGDAAAGEGVRADAGMLQRAVARAAHVPQQLLYVSDPLGLMGGARLADQVAGAGQLEGLMSGVPAAVLRVAVEQLRSAPVWRALQDVVPGTGRGR